MRRGVTLDSFPGTTHYTTTLPGTPYEVALALYREFHPTTGTITVDGETFTVGELTCGECDRVASHTGPHRHFSRVQPHTPI